MKIIGKRYPRVKVNMDDGQYFLISFHQMDFLKQLYDWDFNFAYAEGSEKATLRSLEKLNMVDIQTSGKCILTDLGEAVTERILDDEEQDVA